MAQVGKEQFDADLAAEQTGQANLITAQGTYIAAVTAFIALPPVIDLSAEDATVNAGLQAVNDAGTALAAAQAALPPPPPGKPTS